MALWSRTHKESGRSHFPLRGQSSSFSFYGSEVVRCRTAHLGPTPGRRGDGVWGGKVEGVGVKGRLDGTVRGRTMPTKAPGT